MKTERVKTIYKILLSGIVILQTSMIFIMPNAGSYLGRILPNWFVGYANLLALNTNWNFFSPDPAHVMYFRYLVHFEDDQGRDTREPVEGFFPTFKDKSEMSLHHRRELYTMRFMALDQKRIKKFFAPWVCKQNPSASLVEIEHVIETIAPLDLIEASGKDMQDLSQKIEFVKFDHQCQGTRDEIDF